MNTETENTAATNESEAVYFEYWVCSWVTLVGMGVGVPAVVLFRYLLLDDWPSVWGWALWAVGPAVVVPTGLVVEWRARRKKAAREGVSTSMDESAN